MRILFNLMDCGVGNNGGSSTIIRSANTLVDMGHDVTIIDTGKNEYTWTPLKAKHLIIHHLKYVPDADVMIATGYNTVESTVKLPDRCGKKYHWLRAWESWQMNENRIVQHILKAPTTKIVNSLCLQNKLQKFGFKSYLIRPGYDFDEIYPLNIREPHTIILGGLYSESKHWNHKRTDWIIRAANIMKEQYDNIKLHMFGTRSADHPNITHYLRSPNVDHKNYFYNRVDIWLAPNMREGLHMPPAEAMMTECPVVGTEAEMSGMQDYLFNCQTGIVTKDTFEAFVEGIKVLIDLPRELLHFGKQARKQIISLGDRKQNMEKMISLFEELK